MSIEQIAGYLEVWFAPSVLAVSIHWEPTMVTEEWLMLNELRLMRGDWTIVTVLTRAVMPRLRKALNSLLPSGKLWINQARRDLHSDIYRRMRTKYVNGGFSWLATASSAHAITYSFD